MPGTVRWETKKSEFITFIDYARYSVFTKPIVFRVHHFYNYARWGITESRIRNLGIRINDLGIRIRE